jgi:predicted GNAT family acetyltransferase
VGQHVLDRSVWHSLVGAHGHLSRRHGTAHAYDPEVSPFAGAEGDGDAAWADLRRNVEYRVGRRLVAMAGERFHPPEYTELSAVFTDDDFRGRGYAERAMRTIGAGIVARGEIPFLHVATDNSAITIYERPGFVTRLEYEVAAVVIPKSAT